MAHGLEHDAVQLFGDVLRAHWPVTVVLRIERQVTDALVAHRIVAHLIDDHLQQMQVGTTKTVRTVVIDEHQPSDHVDGNQPVNLALGLRHKGIPRPDDLVHRRHGFRMLVI